MSIAFVLLSIQGTKVFYHDLFENTINSWQIHLWNVQRHLVF